MAYPGLRKAEMMGYFMDQGLSDLVLNPAFGRTGAQNRATKKGDAIREMDPLKIAFFRPGDPLIQTEEQVPFPQPQLL